MKKSEQYYTKEQQELFTDHFLLKGDQVKAQFRDYLEDYIRKNGVPLEEGLKKPAVYVPPYWEKNKPPKQLQRNHYKYDSHNMLWEKDSRDNILTHMLPLILKQQAHDSYQRILKILKTLENMNKLHPDWNHKNKEGNTPLHLMIKQGEYALAMHLVKEFNIDTNVKNKNGDYYTFLMVQTTGQISPRVIVEEFNKNPHHFDSASMNKLVEIKTNISKLQNNYQANHSNLSVEQVHEIFNPLYEFLNHYYLKKVMRVKESDKSQKKKI